MGGFILKCAVIVASLFATLQEATADEGHVWNIALGHDWGAYEYIDSRGYLAGFTMDMVTAVCNAANMNCNLIWDPYTNCMDSEAGQHMKGGKGLLGGWYDACSMWVKTSARIQIFMFSDPMIPDEPANFYVTTGRGSLSLSDIVNKNVGFLDGWSSDEKCVEKVHGQMIDPVNIKHFQNPTDLVTALTSNKVDFIFATPKPMQQYVDSGTIEIVSNIPSKKCSISGHSMMTRKDNLFNEHFNEGLNKILANGQYRKLCDDAEKTHGQQNKGSITCLDI